MISIFVACLCILFFFFNDTATTEIYTLSLHDALPILNVFGRMRGTGLSKVRAETSLEFLRALLSYRFTSRLEDRKSTRLNSSHANISYAVFCLKKKKNI